MTQDTEQLHDTPAAQDSPDVAPGGARHGGNYSRPPVEDAADPQCDAAGWEIRIPGGGIVGGNGIKPGCATDPAAEDDSAQDNGVSD